MKQFENGVGHRSMPGTFPATSRLDEAIRLTLKPPRGFNSRRNVSNYEFQPLLLRHQICQCRHRRKHSTRLLSLCHVLPPSQPNLQMGVKENDREHEEGSISRNLNRADQIVAEQRDIQAG